jgi:hypothetical protein
MILRRWYNHGGHGLAWHWNIKSFNNHVTFKCFKPTNHAVMQTHSYRPIHPTPCQCLSPIPSTYTYDPAVNPFNLILSFNGGGAIGATTILSCIFHFGATSPGYSHLIIILPYRQFAPQRIQYLAEMMTYKPFTFLGKFEDDHVARFLII